MYISFPGCSTLSHLQATLEHQPLYVELLQDSAGPDHPPLMLATFETSGLEFLFPYPQLRPTYNSGVDVDLLMEPTREFPGVISPKVIFSVFLMKRDFVAQQYMHSHAIESPIAVCTVHSWFYSVSAVIPSIFVCWR